MPLFAASISSSVSTLFMAMNCPPTLMSGRHSSDKIESCATAREVAMSNCSRCCMANSSARAWTQATRFNCSSSQTSCSQVTRFPSESSSVRSKSSFKMRSGIPGKPAPVPTSTTVLPVRSTKGSSAALSSRWSCATASGSVMAVRFITSFFSSSREEKRSSVSARLTSSPSSLRPCKRSSFICSAPSKGRGSR